MSQDSVIMLQSSPAPISPTANPLANDSRGSNDERQQDDMEKRGAIEIILANPYECFPREQELISPFQLEMHRDVEFMERKAVFRLGKSLS